MSRCVYVIINHDTNQSYAGLTKNVARRVTDHRRLKPRLFSGRYSVLQTDALSDADALSVEGRAIRLLRALGFHALNIKQAGSLGSASGSPWSKDACAAEARRYTARKDFELNSTGAYVMAQRRGWLSEICAHMPRRKRPNGYWTKDRCAEVAARYRSRAEFKRGAISVHNIAERRGWMKDICRHMTYRKHSRTLRRP